MKRQIIEIDETKCNGCGLCAAACHEGAIGMVGGKAKLLRDDYCDGLGNCLPACPAGAIAFVEREAAAYDEEAAMRSKASAKPPCACPGTEARSIAKTPGGATTDATEAVSAGATTAASAGATAAASATAAAPATAAASADAAAPATGELRQWPVQIKLVPVKAPYFDGANLLVAADCTAYARAGFHAEFMRGKVTVIGCPKLDSVDYAEKLAAIVAENDIQSLTVVRMEVPCCGGIEQAAAVALKNSGKILPWRVVTLGIDGEIRGG